jgi:endoglycosylceramidase
VPLWLLDEMPKSRSDFPWPLSYEAINVSLFAAYVTESCGFAFQCLYDNTNGFADYFELYWQLVSQAFAGNTAVLGYELINEPWAGDIYADPLLLLPGVAGRFNLMKLYDKAYKMIRQHDNDTLVFYEPVTWGVLLNLNYFGVGFLRPPGNDPDRTVLSWHYYCWLLQFVQNPLKNGTYPVIDKIVCDEIQLKASFDTISFDMLSLGGGPSFLTEFGVCAFPVDEKDENSSKLNTDECEAVLNAGDRYLQSWCYWDSNFYNNKTLQLIPEIVHTFSRVYPQSTNGLPQSIVFNSTSKEFIYKYKLNVTDLDEASQVPTVIVIPRHVYPHGFQVLCSPHLTWSFDQEQSKLLVTLGKDGKKIKKSKLHPHRQWSHQDSIVNIISSDDVDDFF